VRLRNAPAQEGIWPATPTPNTLSVQRLVRIRRACRYLGPIGKSDHCVTVLGNDRSHVTTRRWCEDVHVGQSRSADLHDLVPSAIGDFTPGIEPVSESHILALLLTVRLWVNRGRRARIAGSWVSPPPTIGAIGSFGDTRDLLRSELLWPPSPTRRLFVGGGQQHWSS
jgi:hypothetical protein